MSCLHMKVYKALCVPCDRVVAIKMVDLEASGSSMVRLPAFCGFWLESPHDTVNGSSNSG